MDILNDFVKKARATGRTVIFPEGDEERTLTAAVRLAKDGVCTVCVTAARREDIEETARREGLDIGGLEVLTPSPELIERGLWSAFVARRMEKGAGEDEAERMALEPLYFAALYVAGGKADACVAGARSNTADVLRAAIQGVGMAPEVKLVSSFFLMVPPQGHPLVKQPVLFADCAVNPAPGSLGLRDIGLATIRSHRCLFPEEVTRAAFLSFSTKNSADHASLKKVREAVSMVQSCFEGDPSVFVDGELQFDAAVAPEVARKKLSDSPVAGRANVLVFPDLNAGNIGYKMAERLGGFKAVGPVIQGLARPFSDLSRGCSADDIYYVTAVTLLQK